MRKIALFLGLVFIVHPGYAADVSDIALERYFKKTTVSGNHVAALKKRIFQGDVAYLATIHGYPNNLAVCESLIAPYNSDASKSVLPGTYFCELL